MELLLKHNFVYESSMMGNDYMPYRVRKGDVVTLDQPMTFGPQTPLIELPISWTLDDYPHFEFLRTKTSVLPGLMNADSVLGNWISDYAYMQQHVDWGVLSYTFPAKAGTGAKAQPLDFNLLQMVLTAGPDSTAEVQDLTFKAGDGLTVTGDLQTSGGAKDSTWGQWIAAPKGENLADYSWGLYGQVELAMYGANSASCARSPVATSGTLVAGDRSISLRSARHASTSALSVAMRAFAAASMRAASAARCARSPSVGRRANACARTRSPRSTACSAEVPVRGASSSARTARSCARSFPSAMRSRGSSFPSSSPRLTH